MSQITLSGGAARTGLSRRQAADPFSLVSLLIALVVVAVTVASVVTVVWDLFVVHGHVTLTPFEQAFADGNVLKPLRNTAIVVGLSTVFAVIIGGALAWFNERTDARMGLFSDVAPLAPFVMPPVAGSIGFAILFSPDAGYLNKAWYWVLGLVGIHTQHPLLDAYSWTGLIAVFTVYGVPFTYMMIAPALRMMDSSLEEASKVFGAGGMRTALRVTLPSVLPAVGAGAFLWIWIACSMVDVPLLLGTPHNINLLAPQIISLLTYQYPPDESGAVALSTIITVVVVLAWFVQSRILRSSKFATVGGKGSRTQVVRLGRVGRPVARIAMILYVLGTTLLPGLALLYISLAGSWRSSLTFTHLSLSQFKAALSDEQTFHGLINSLWLSLVAATIVILLAAVIALYVSRSRGIVGRLVDAGVKVPGTVGALIVVVGILLIFEGSPFFLGGTVTILLIAYVMLALPNASVSADAAVAGVGESLSEASRMSGASEFRTFARVVLPLLIPGLVGVWASVFVRTLSDLTASSLLAGTNNPVIGFDILQQSTYGSYATMATLCTILAIFSAVAVLGAAWLGRRVSRWTQDRSAAPVSAKQGA